MAYDAHFIIPFASSADPACVVAIAQLKLPNLTRFLKQADSVSTDLGDEFDFIPPHERVLNNSVHAELVEAQVLVTPCHWSVGIDNIRMENPDDLQLTEHESEALFTAVSPYFLEDDILLTYQSSLVWHASSALFMGLPMASLDRAIGQNVDVWQPPAAQSKSIRRLQNEMQMLLYTHPINEVREARGLPTVNSFWLSPEAHFDARFDFSLRDSALRGDWHAWSEAWQTLDSKLAQASTVTLCGERHACTYAIPQNRTIVQNIKHLIAYKLSTAKALLNL